MLKINEYFKFSDLDHNKQDKLYQLFKKSYEKATGAAWDQGTFERKAYGWIFYGDPEKGGVAVRPQRSGPLKMNAVFGSPRAIKQGMDELMTTQGDVPMWTVADLSLVQHLEPLGFKRPPVFLIKMLAPTLAGVMGTEVKEIAKDGALVVNTVSGVHHKYFTGNKAYYKWLMGQGVLDNVGKMAGKAIQAFINKLTK